MYNAKAYELGSKRSSIREIFEYAKKRREEIGEDKVFDFSKENTPTDFLSLSGYVYINLYFLSIRTFL